MIKIGVIPARFSSTRLPGKPLQDINGKPMIQRVYENVKKSKLDRVIVATDDEKIYKEVLAFGGEVVMTSSDHINGSSRIGEVAKKIEADIIINIQGDEPLVDAETIDFLLTAFEDDKCNMVTMKSKIEDMEDLKNPNCVKVVTDKNSDALLFSRSQIPYNREKTALKYFKHIGIYGYRKNFLLKYLKMEPTELELTESLEQLRVLENGYKIKVLETDKDFHGVDTFEDLEKIRKILSE